ncbi:MAG: hypothetical protein RSC44_02590 [Clostridia bacterium]
MMETYKTMAHIHSLDGKMDEITVLAEEYLFGKRIPNSYIVGYNGKQCTAIFNEFVGEFYADDIYGVVAKYEKN